MKPVAFALAFYGAFLILAGLTGYLSNPEKAKTALMSGGLFGLLNLGLAWAASRSWRPSLSLGLGLAGFLGLVFSWRAVVTWMALFAGEPGKLVAALLISAMLVATIGVFVFLMKRWRDGALPGDPDSEDHHSPSSTAHA